MMERNFPSWNSLSAGGVNLEASVHGVASQPWPTLPAVPTAAAAGAVAVVAPGGAAAWKAGLEGSIHSISEVEVEDRGLPGSEPWWAGKPGASASALGGRVGSGTADDGRAERKSSVDGKVPVTDVPV